MSGDGALGAQAHLKSTTASVAEYLVERKHLKEASDGLIISKIHAMPQEWIISLFHMLTQLRDMNLYDADYRAELVETCQTFAYSFILRMTDDWANPKLRDIEWPWPPAR